MTAEERIAFTKAKSQETEELLVCARKHTHNLFEQGTYTEYLKLMGKFHRYSFINVLLIQMQFPGAEYVSGVDTWKTVAMDTYNNPSYKILRSQYFGKGIKILVPFTVTDSESKWRERRLIHIPVSVFDVGQVNNLPLPEEEVFDVDSVQKFLMQTIRSSAPYRLVLANKTDGIIAAGMNAYFKKPAGFIVINDSLNETQRIKEYLRVWSEKEIEDLWFEKRIDGPYSGFAASSVECVVRSALGLASDDITFQYVSLYKSENPMDLWPVLHCIQVASHRIIERLTEDLLDVRDMEANDWMDDDLLFDFDLGEAEEHEV